MYIMVFLAFFQVYGIRKEGFQPEYIVGLVVCTVVWAGCLWMVRDKNPYLILSAKGFSLRARNSRLILWEEIHEIDFHNAGRTLSLRFKTKYGPKDVVAKMITWNVTELLRVTETLRAMKFEEREKFIEHLLEVEKQEP
jgi:hypothetical protein